MSTDDIQCLSSYLAQRSGPLNIWEGRSKNKRREKTEKLRNVELAEVEKEKKERRLENLSPPSQTY